MHFTFKTCEIVAGIIVTCQFHEFLNLFLADYLQFGSTISHSLMTLSIGIYDVREEMCATPSSSGFAQFFFRSPPIYWRLLRLIIFVHLAHGLRTPNEAFFSLKSQTFGLGQTTWAINFGALGVFWAKLLAPILVQWVPCPLFNHYFYKNQAFLSASQINITIWAIKN